MGVIKKKVIEGILKDLGASSLYNTGPSHLSCTYMGQELPAPIFVTHGPRTKRDELPDVAVNTLAHGLYTIDERIHGRNAMPLDRYKQILKGRIKVRRGRIEELLSVIIGLILLSVFSYKFSITGNIIRESGQFNPLILISVLSLIAVIVILLIKTIKK